MKWIIGLLCLIFLILFHEFGHFIAAKIFGVKVESFSVGFGPILLHKTIKGTDYRLSLFPLGGYCGMKGEKDFEKALDEKLPYIEGEPDSLYGVHPFKRALICFAGPFFNLISAFAAFTTINLIGFTYYTFPNEIKVVEDVSDIGISESPAIKGGLLTGDKILKINEKEISDYSEIVENISLHPDEDILVIVDRDSKILEFNIHTGLNKKTGAGILGVLPNDETILQKESEKYNVFQAAGKGFTETFSYIGLTFKSIGLLFKGVEIKNAVSGPVRITDLIGSTVKDSFAANARAGFVNMFSLLGLISVSLFIMNLLPIPVLDGGLILFAFIEIIFRKKINPKIQYYIQFVGLGFIVILFLIGTYGDISYFIERGIHK